MKTKVTLFLLLLFAMGGSLFAQVQINVPSSYQPATLEQGGAPGTYKVDIVNNNAAALSGTFSLELPTGMEYIAGSIAGGGVESNIGNLQRPDFSISIPSGNTLSLTFSARINCGFVNSSIVYQVIVNSANAATAVSAVAANTPASAYVFLQVPSPQALSTPLSTNATRTIKFKNTGNVAVNTVYFESNVVTAAQYPYYKLLSASNGTIAPVTNGYRITLTGAALQSAITTSVGAANASFDKDEEITLVLTEQMTSCAAGSAINLNMKVGSGDSKSSFCFFDSSTASITTPVAAPSISLTRLSGTTWPTFCDNGKVSYTIKNEGSGSASSLFNIKLPWSTVYTSSSTAPIVEPAANYTINKVSINGTDVTSLVLKRNGTGASALIPGEPNCFVIDLAGLTSANGSVLQSLNGDGKYDDLAAGQSFQLDLEYGFNPASYKTCSLNSYALPSTGGDYFSIGTSYMDQCGARNTKTNYASGGLSGYAAQTFQVGSQQYGAFSASLSKVALNPGDKITLTTNFGGTLSGAFSQGSSKLIKTFTIILPDGLDYDATGTTRFIWSTSGSSSVIPTSSINYNAATKTLLITPLATLAGLNSGNDVLEIPLIAGAAGTNKTLQYSATIGFVGCGVTMPYGCNSTAINYAVLDGGGCPTVGTSSFDITRATFGYVPAPSNTNVWYTPTAFVDENTPNINLHGAVAKDKVKTTFTGIVNSTNFTELWARVKYTSNAATLNLSNFDKLSANGADIAGSITVTKASDGSTLSTNITVADIVFSYDSGTSRQLQQVNLGTKIGAGKDINYTLQVGDKIAVNWFTKVTRDNLSYVYSSLQNLEGDLYTKDSGGAASNCQPIPVTFYIQRLSVTGNSFVGIQSVVGLNSMRIQASLLNGNGSADIPGDHFPNEVRNYGIFRNVTWTVPGIWILDTNTGKEPFISTSLQVAAYKVNPAMFTVTYSGGNTIITANNSALGSNGLPLSTANIPVLADWIGANGNQNLSVYLLPVCATPGFIMVPTVQNYDIYTTAADNSNTESYAQQTFTLGGTNNIVYYNYSANAAPTLQNVDGIGSTVNWQVRVTNTSDTAAIVAAGGGASLPNNWMSFESPNNNITVTKLTDIATGTVYPVVNYGTGKYWVKLGDIATTVTYNVEATYTTCVDDKLQFTYNFGATGYPIDPVQGYGGGLGTCAGTQTTAVLNLYPKDIAIDMTVVTPPSPVQFCTNETAGENKINYSMTVTNTAVGNAENLIMEAAFPANYTARAGTSKLTYDGTTKSIGDPLFNTAKGVWQWYISADANGIPFLPGASSGKNIMTLSYQGETTCGYVSGSSVSYNMRATSGCGQVKEKSVSGSGMALSMVPSSMNTYYLTPSVINLKNDGSGAVYSIQILNQGSNPISSNENIYVTIPSSIDYVAGSVVPVLGGTNITAPISNTVVGNTRVIAFPFPTGSGGGGLVQNETASFNIQFKIVNAAALSCGKITDAVKLESIYAVPSVTCGATSCPVIFVTGTGKSDASIVKTNLVITPGTSSATFASTTNNDVTVKYTVGNTGTIANSTAIVVDFFNDLNKDGLYTTGEPILYTQTITGTAANLAAGATSAEQTTAVFSIPETGMCAITAAIRLVNNTQVCADSATLIPLKYASAQTAFTVCGKSDVTIGNAPNGATVSWSPTTYLSDAAISNPVFNYTGTPVTAVTDFVYTATVTHPGGCTNTFTNTVTVNPDPVVTITDPAAVCTGASVDLSAAAVTTGSAANLKYTYFTDVDATAALVNYTAVTTAGTYYIKGTNANGCYTVKPVVVKVNPLPTASIGATGPACKGDATAPVVTFTGANGTAPYTFTYKIGNGSNLTVSTVSGNSVNVPASTAAAGSFVYTLVSVKDSSTSACTQTQTGTATVTINPLPTAAIAGTTSVCKDDAAPNVTFTGAGGTAPYTFTYKVNGGADQTVTTTSGNAVTVAQLTDTAGSFAYTLVSVKDASTTACTQAQTGTATITVKALPTATIAGTAAVCKDAAAPNVTFTGAGGTAPYTFTYKLNSGADQTVTTTTGSSVTVAQPTGTAGSFVYTLVSVKDGSTSACTQVQTGTATITVNPLPTATIAGTTAVCKDGTAPTVTLTGAGGTSPYTFTYKVNGGADQTVTTTGGSVAMLTAPTAAAGSFVYTLVSVKDASTSACTQVQTGTATITVNPLPTAAIAGTTAVCKDAAAPNVTFTGAGGTAPYTFTYKLNNGADQTVTTTTSNSVTVAQPTGTAGSFVYTLVSVKDASTSACTQAQTGTATITVNPLPTAAIAGTTAVCKDAAAPTVTFTGAGGTAPYTFTYRVNGGADQTVTTTSGDAVTVAQATGTVGDFVYTLVSVKDASSTACVQTQTGTATVT